MNMRHPIKFDPLADFFTNHAAYKKAWEQLFLYETFNILVTSKRSIENDKNAGGFNDQTNKRQKDLSFVGYLINGSEDQYFVNARLYDKIPQLSTSGQTQRGKDDENENTYSALRTVKESDVLIISTEEICPLTQDIKRLVNPNWLKSTLLKPNSMFAYVNERSKKGALFCELKIDYSKTTFLKQQSTQNGYIKVYVYILESLSTNIREYKTLKMSEFYGLCDVIVDPKKALKE